MTERERIRELIVRLRDLSTSQCPATEDEAVATWKAAREAGVHMSLPAISKRDVLTALIEAVDALPTVAKSAPVPTVSIILAEWLGAHGYDGLVEQRAGCACRLPDLCQCGEILDDCVAGHEGPCDCGEGCGFHIVEGRRPPSTVECGGCEYGERYPRQCGESPKRFCGHDAAPWQNDIDAGTPDWCPVRRGIIGWNPPGKEAAE